MASSLELKSAWWSPSPCPSYGSRCSELPWRLFHLLGAHPAASDTTHAATCAALCGSDSATESLGLKESCPCPILKFLGGALFSISIMESKSELQPISEEDEILTSAWYWFIHNNGNQSTFNVFTKQWWRFRLTLNIFENLRHFLGDVMFTAYT